MNTLTRIFENTIAYRLIQAPFAGDKLAPLFRHNDVRTFRRVLDVGCGPGTNTRHFRNCDYLGLDINPGYVKSARRRHGRAFEVADVRTWRPPANVQYDSVLLNSFLHHLSDADTHQILANIRPAISADGHLHLLDLVMPPDLGIAYALARLDRGDYPRPAATWRSIFATHYETISAEEYPVGIGSRTLWNMIYLKGRVRP